MVLIDGGSVEAGDVASVGAVISRVLRTESRERWCNLTYEVDEDGVSAPDSALFAFLAARGPSSPLATVMASSGTDAIEIGIQHRAGVKAAAQLAEQNVDLGQGWVVRQDHPRRGIVVAVPPDATGDEIADWVLNAMDVLTRVPSTGRLFFELYEAT